MQHWKYLNYLLRHKWFVFVAGLRTKAPLWRLLIHDWSKFMPSEWIPYARFFYGKYPSWDEVKFQCPGYNGPTKESIEETFDRAWLHHQHLNAHHWQHWVLRNDDGSTKPLCMPERFVREMVADWAGAGRAITGKWEVREWYSKNSHKIVLHDFTRRRVLELLDEF